MRAATAALAAAPGSASGPPPQQQQPKAFDDAERYQREIRMLVPGYDALHELVPAVLAAVLPAEAARLLFVGCGPGHELIAMARRLPWCIVDAIDPSAAMAEAAVANVEAASLAARVKVVPESLQGFAIARPYDAVVAILVGHLIADDGSRAEFLEGLAAALRPGGVAVLVELVDDGSSRQLLTRAHLLCAEHAGASPARLEVMHERLSHGFHALSGARAHALLQAAGLSCKAEFFRAFGVVGYVVEKGANDA